MKEIRIGSLRVEAAPLDFQALVAAAEAIQVARRIVEQATALGAELERVAGPVAELLASVVTPREPGDDSSSGLGTMARVVARRRKRGGAGAA